MQKCSTPCRMLQFNTGLKAATQITVFLKPLGEPVRTFDEAVTGLRCISATASGLSGRELISE